MAKIIKFNKDNENAVNFLECWSKEAESENIDNAIVLSKLKNGEIELGFTRNLDLCTMQELCSHLQIQIMYEVLLGNGIEE